jgi:hypothetical protein
MIAGELPHSLSLSDFESLYWKVYRRSGPIMLMVTDQGIFDRLWARSAPKDIRSSPKSGNIWPCAGHPAIMINDVELIADWRCPPQHVLFFTPEDVLNAVMWNYEGLEEVQPREEQPGGVA